VSYCRSIVECEELAGKLNYGLFYAGRPNNPEALKKWLAEGGIIVASTALGTGVSYPGVMLVVHVGLPYGLIDFLQESRSTLSFFSSKDGRRRRTQDRGRGEKSGTATKVL
jgi:superfamily II DNA helicase RecQ